MVNPKPLKGLYVITYMAATEMWWPFFVISFPPLLRNNAASFLMVSGYETPTVISFAHIHD